MSIENQYMQQVMEAQADVEMNLKKRARRAVPVVQAAHSNESTVTIEAGPETPAVDVRITGFWRWKNVIVPPSAYVVHTRRGREEPLHCGLGTSFRFNPVTDSFLVVPAAMQTIIINARCICQEKQGILVQGYVQWAIEDFSTAYRKLDFSDAIDPMGVVNIQLREQAEAVIKDMVATMTLESVLSDRQPIITELTDRLAKVMEGRADDSGLGLRIVTVQIKEAVVSSATVWETLQRPFRAERRRAARLAELEQEVVIRERESEERKASEVLDIETSAEISRRRSESEASAFDRQQAEIARRARIEAEALEQALDHEKSKAGKRAELEVLRITNENSALELRHAAANNRALTEIKTEAARRKVENDLSPELLRDRLIAALPDIAERMPKPDSLKSVSINGAEGLGTLLPALMELLDRAGARPEAS